jgi:hypothetical protein
MRYEATHRTFSTRDRIIWATVAVIVGSLLVILIPDTVTRQMARRIVVGLCVFSSLLWAPALLKQGSLRFGTIAIGIYAIGIVIERSIPLLRLFSAAPADPGVFPYVRESDVFQILAGGAAIIFFSAERARHERRALASQSSSHRSP